jgi:hypothetical protein
MLFFLSAWPKHGISEDWSSLEMAIVLGETEDRVNSIGCTCRESRPE